jgi:hypothetical protein
MIKKVFLHVVAFVMILPCLLMFNAGSTIINFLGLAWVLFLVAASNTNAGKRFLRSYYREILRLERM